MSAIVHVRAPCRLHFGMFSFGRNDRPQYGGVGVMLEPPTVAVTIRPAERLVTVGDHSGRARRFVERAAESWQLSSLPNCEVEVSSPPDHTGLGVGTQLGLSIAAGLRRFLGLPALAVEDLAASVGRGQRSAVGTYGFDAGGLIVDAGHNAKNPVARLARRVELPLAWRFVLIRPTREQGLAGDRESEAFAKLPAVADSVTDELWQITYEEMLPAAVAADCDRFGEAVYRFGRLAGECFAPVQGGPFANEMVGELVAAIRRFGVAGVGQSSWGPTVFAVVATDAAAEQLVRRLQSQPNHGNFDVTIGRQNNTGATVRS